MNKEKRESMMKRRPLSVDPRPEADQSAQKVASNIAEPNTLEGPVLKINK
jgi:hypothetical protein